MLYEYVLLFITVTGNVDFSEKDRETTTLILRVFNLVIKISIFFISFGFFDYKNVHSGEYIVQARHWLISAPIPIFIQMNSGWFFSLWV